MSDAERGLGLVVDGLLFLLDARLEQLYRELEQAEAHRDPRRRERLVLEIERADALIRGLREWKGRSAEA
jgi:hypothetical protein